jgi:hypothetical protein
MLENSTACNNFGGSVYYLSKPPLRRMYVLKGYSPTKIIVSSVDIAWCHKFPGVADMVL